MTRGSVVAWQFVMQSFEGLVFTYQVNGLYKQEISEMIFLLPLYGHCHSYACAFYSGTLELIWIDY